MSSGQRPQHLVFALVSVVLVVSAILFSRSGPGEGSPREAAQEGPSSERTQLARQLIAETDLTRARVEGVARRFFAAYLRYEVGLLDAGVRSAIRGTCAPEFATLLLANAPRAPSQENFPAPAQLQSIDVSLEAPGGDRALVEGSALRGQMPEEFSFEFELSGGAWRVIGVGEQEIR